MNYTRCIHLYNILFFFKQNEKFKTVIRYRINIVILNKKTLYYQ